MVKLFTVTIDPSIMLDSDLGSHVLTLDASDGFANSIIEFNIEVAEEEEAEAAKSTFAGVVIGNYFDDSNADKDNSNAGKKKGESEDEEEDLPPPPAIRFGKISP
jgi:hypothetical protein